MALSTSDHRSDSIRPTPASRHRSRLAALLAGAAIVALPALPAVAFGPLDDVHLAGASSTTASQINGIDPVTNFPIWFQDMNGTTLQLCTANNDPLHLCLFAPIDPAAPNAAYQQQIGFADEAFWWLAQADFDILTPDCPDCRRGLALMSLEAAYNGGPALRNDEFTFGRLRLWIDTPYKGHYKVTYPFGVEEFDADAGIKGIRTTIDTGTAYPDYSGPLHADSKIRNFLTWDPAVAPSAPPGYVGDTTVTHAVVGATHYEPDPVSGEWLPFNKVRIELTACAADAPVCPPAVAGQPLWAIETDQFTVQGRVWDGQVPTPLAVQRATIMAGAGSPVVSVFAQSLAGANVTVSLDGGAAKTMPSVSSTGTAANFQLDIPWSGSALPKVATVSAQLTGDLPASLKVPVTDVVALVGNPQYDVQSRTLTVSATSSAQGMTPAPVLSLFGVNLDLVAPQNPGVSGATYSLSIPKIPPSSTLKVISSLGGSQTGVPQPINAPVVVPPPVVVAPPPVAVADSASTSILTPVVVPVATNDTGSLDLNSIQVVANSGPAKGSIGPIGPSGITYIPSATFTSGTDTFQYTIANPDQVRSAPATVTITMQPEQIIPTVDQWTRSNGAWRVRGTTNATTNNTITAYLVHGATQTLIGSILADGLGNYDICTACNKGGNFIPAGNAKPVAGDTVKIVSSYGTTVAGNVITIK